MEALRNFRSMMIQLRAPSMSWLRVAVACLAVFGVALPSSCQAPAQSSGPSPGVEEVRHLLEQLAAHSPDPCGPPYGIDANTRDLGDDLFSKVSDLLVGALNASASASASPQQRIEALSGSLEQLSAGINQAWPEEARLRLQLYDFSPALVVKMSIRTQQGFRAFGLTKPTASVTRSWNEIGSDELDSDNAMRNVIDLYPLHRGPSGNPRFLTRILSFGCAGSLGLEYNAWEWDVQNMDHLSQGLNISGALGLDDKVAGFPQTGELKTAGNRITLPWCWFSPIDTWDNPSLCAEDTWDVSGNGIVFRSRRWNRPDLLPIAKALDYASNQDYPAVRAYCTSSAVARKVIHAAPNRVGSAELQVVRIGAGRERVSILDDSSSIFDVVRQGNRWLVAGFH
jgi:hypothetical protein